MKRISKDNFKKYIERESISWMKILYPAFIASFLGPLYYFFDLFSHFALQYMIGGIILGGLLVYSRRPYWAALAFIIALACAIESRLHLQEPLRLHAPGGAADFTVTTFNHNVGQNNFKPIIKYISNLESKPDAFILQEASAKTVEMAKELSSFYPYQLHNPKPHAFGMVIISRTPFLKVDNIFLQGKYLKSYAIRFTIQPEGLEDPVTIYALHAFPPTSPRNDNHRNTELRTLARIIEKDTASNKIMIGDWNITPFSPVFGEMLELSGLNFQSYGLMLNASWPSFLLFGFLQIPIDHILFSDDLVQIDKETGPALMSDHYMLTGRFTEK